MQIYFQKYVRLIQMSNHEGLEAAQRNALSAIQLPLDEEHNFPGFTQEDKEVKSPSLRGVEKKRLGTPRSQITKSERS